MKANPQGETRGGGRKAVGAGCGLLVEERPLEDRKTSATTETRSSGPTRTSCGEAHGKPPRSSLEGDGGVIFHEVGVRGGYGAQGSGKDVK